MRIPRPQSSLLVENPKDLPRLNWNNLCAFNRALREIHFSLSRCETQEERRDLLSWARYKTGITDRILLAETGTTVEHAQRAFHVLATALDLAKNLDEQGYVGVKIDQEKQQFVGVTLKDITKSRQKDALVLGDIRTWYAMAAALSRGFGEYLIVDDRPNYFQSRYAYPFEFKDQDEWLSL